MAKIDPDAKLRMMLEAVIEEYAQNAARRDVMRGGTDFPGAFRDALTNLKHIADEKGIDFDETVIVALEVAAQETEKHIAEAVPDPEYFIFAGAATLGLDGGSFYKIEGGIVSAYFKKYKTWEPIPGTLAEWARKNMTKINAALVPLEAFVAPASGPEAGGPGR